jgi:hypothetical protein
MAEMIGDRQMVIAQADQIADQAAIGFPTAEVTEE